jgi:A/G-specific adenine glycosylase
MIKKPCKLSQPQRNFELLEARRALLAWYRQQGRKLPWRNTADPYAVWISEVMLQQTQVSRIVPYYERFMKRFPDVNTLARAGWRQLLPYWRGLGYYGRGRNLLKTAKLVSREHGGRIPKDLETLQTLPGIGPYTAAAIASFAYSACVPAVDTNVQRVVERLTGCPPEGAQEAAKSLFFLAGRSAASLNHALMDLGAELCRSGSVRCSACPLRTHCVYAANGDVPRAPRRRRPRGKRAVVEVAAACIGRDGRFLVAEKRRGLWEFPGGKREPGEDIRACLKREIREELGIEISVRPAFLTVDFEKDEVPHRLRFCRSRILSGAPRPLAHRSLRWVRPDELPAMNLAETNRSAALRLSSMKAP